MIKKIYKFFTYINSLLIIFLPLEINKINGILNNVVVADENQKYLICYYISDEKVYEVGADEPVFTEFPAQFLSSGGGELAVYGNGQVKLGEKTYTLP